MRFAPMCMAPNIEVKTKTVLLKIRTILMIFKWNISFHLNIILKWYFYFRVWYHKYTTKSFLTVYFIKDIADFSGLPFVHHCSVFLTIINDVFVRLLKIIFIFSHKAEASICICMHSNLNLSFVFCAWYMLSHLTPFSTTGISYSFRFSLNSVQ